MARPSDGELVAVSVYMPKKLHERILVAAKLERRSISSQIVIILEKCEQMGTLPGPHVIESDRPLE